VWRFAPGEPPTQLRKAGLGTQEFCQSIPSVEATTLKNFRATIPQNLLFWERFFMDDGQGQEWTQWTE